MSRPPENFDSWIEYALWMAPRHFSEVPINEIDHDEMKEWEVIEQEALRELRKAKELAEAIVKLAENNK